jgi:hypothetical protein
MKGRVISHSYEWRLLLMGLVWPLLYERNNTMEKILGVVFGLVVLVGGVAVYAKCSSRLCLVSATPINPAVISAEELESKNNKIAALEETVEEKNKIIASAKKELDDQQLKSMIRIEELQNRVAVLRVTLEANKTELQKALNETQKVLEWETAPKK